MRAGPLRSGSSAAPAANVEDVERAASVVLGAALLALGTRRASPACSPLALGGGMLLYRGLSGRCPAYHPLGLTSIRSEGGQRQSARLGPRHRVNPATKALGSAPEKLMQRALCNFKRLAETGEVPNIRQNPAARRGGQEHQRH